MLTDGRKSSQDRSKDRRKFTYYYLKSTNHVLPMKNPKALPGNSVLARSLRT